VTRARLARLLWIGAAALLVAAALVAVVALLRGEFSDTDGKILLTLGATFLCGSTALAGLALAETHPRLGLPVAALAPVEFALIAWLIWEGDPGDTTLRLGLTALVAAIAQLLAATQLLLLRNRGLSWLVATTALAIAAGAGLTIAGIWAEPDSELLGRIVVALWILVALGWFLLPVLQRYTAAGTAEREDRVLAELEGVRLVATRREAPGDVRVEGRAAAGERLVLRRDAR